MKQSDRLDILLAATLALILALACVPELHCKREKRVDLQIPNACVKKVVLTDCDLNYEPPKCKAANVTYFPRSCAIIHLE